MAVMSMHMDGPVRSGGRAAGRTLLLLHGLGATGAVWDGVARVAEERWAGHWIAPDLLGHGRARRASPYSFGGFAAEMAHTVPRDRDVIAVGHSMGGVVALALASGWFGLRVQAAVGIGIKLFWSEDELARARELARRPARSFETRDKATERYLRVAGLEGHVDPTGPVAAEGVRPGDGGWQLTQDPATFDVGAPDTEGLLCAARGKVLLAAGEHDPMCPPADLRSMQEDGEVLAGLGHNAHVEAPEAIWALIERVAGDTDG